MTLEAHHIAYARGGRQLFSDIGFEVRPGEALWLYGANGSGKSSLLRIVCGLALPAAGEVRWNGRNIHRLREDYYQHLFYCGHAPGIKDDLPAWKNVSIARQLSGMKCGMEDAHRALGRFGLAHAAHLPSAILSQGQRKRVALARLCIEPLPTLLVLDEPFTALDKDSVETLRGILDTHLARDGIVVYTTHQDLTLQARRLHLLDLDEASCSIR